MPVAQSSSHGTKDMVVPYEGGASALHKSCDKLKGAVDFYCFISTVSVYDEDAVTPESVAATGGIDEDGLKRPR